ncbi:predicted protein [Naegleria gruberi]|uniref:Predicted protein n=1 Tax=Naegleria gruberi TaxID=5762 RepID=D2W0S8_NAEGR|nr:uncharacterized protein NAEGRDRAFT_74966 [Naegleria gruberi]EFC37389.1 predicted protein [Naegleria gruberi]|eukprot:XP_002670133.1 predicted protein [Naegleria gruberi strain NEG-M]
MNQDNWTEIIQFLEPIDVLASLLTINRTIYSLIEKCVVSFDNISDYCFNESLNIRILFSDRDDLKNELSDENIPLLGNCRYFVNLYLLKLAFKLENTNPEKMKISEFEKIIDEPQLKLLRFYRSVFSWSKKEEKNVEYLIKYTPIGEHSIGKSTFFNHVQFGHYENTSLWKSEAIKKEFTISNESSLVQVLFDLDPRYQTKETFIRGLIRHNMSFLLSFGINYECTFEKLGDWYHLIKQEKLETMGIMIGLHPHRQITNYELKKINPREVVRKAFHEFGKLLVVEVDMDNKKHVFVPFWFFQLQFTYFKDLKDITHRVLLNETPKTASSLPTNCFI